MKSKNAKQVRPIGFALLLFAGTLFAQGAHAPIQVTCPIGDEIFAVGSQLIVQWILHDNAEPGGGVAVRLSPDDGYSWTFLTKSTITLSDSTVYHDSVGTFTWQIADSVRIRGTNYLHLVSPTCRIEVVAPYDDAYLPASSGLFSIDPATKADPRVRGRRAENRFARPADGATLYTSGAMATIITLDGRCRQAPGALSFFGQHGLAAGTYVMKIGNAYESTATQR
jgi:hypothetical protein